MQVRTVLVVDDDKDFRENICRILTRENIIVFNAQNGEEAKSVLNINDIDLVLSDVRMPVLHGIELLHHIKRTSDVPVILMTGFSDLIEITEAMEIGAKGFINKPFSRDTLISEISRIKGGDSEGVGEKKVQNIEEDTSIDKISEQFIEIEISQFVTGSKFKCPVYISLFEDSYIKIAHEGEDLDPNMIRRYSEKGISYLYLKKQDFIKYLEFNLGISSKVVKSNTVSSDKKKKFISNTTELLLKYSYEIDNKSPLLKRAINNVTYLVNIYSRDYTLLKRLEAFLKTDPTGYKEAVGVSLLANLMFIERRWDSPVSLYKLTLSCLMMNIGKTKVDKKICQKTLAEMTDDDFEKYREYPSHSAQILKDIPNIPPEVIQIVEHHCELCDGTGFPKELTKGKIHTFARVISLAKGFIEILNESNGSDRAFHILEELRIKKNKYDTDFLNILSRIFQKR